jgi:hypothetical protein
VRREAACPRLPALTESGTAGSGPEGRPRAHAGAGLFGAGLLQISSGHADRAHPRPFLYVDLGRLARGDLLFPGSPCHRTRPGHPLIFGTLLGPSREGRPFSCSSGSALAPTGSRRRWRSCASRSWCGCSRPVCPPGCRRNGIPNPACGHVRQGHIRGAHDGRVVLRAAVAGLARIDTWRRLQPGRPEVVRRLVALANKPRSGEP